MLRPLSLLALAAPLAHGASIAGSFSDGGDTLVSAMMMFLGNEEKVYILDKAEGNAAQVMGHPAWGSVWDIQTHETEVMDVRTNVFCSSGMHLPNGSFVTFGGNGAVGPGGNLGSQLNPGGYSAAWDSTYQDFDGTRAIRVLNPCRSSDTFSSPNCQWFDDPTVLSMKNSRWYSAAEPTGEGNIVIIGGFVNGGYINRNYPNVDPERQGGAADSTYEYYPPVADAPRTFRFLIQTSGLNAYAHTFLMPSGKMLVQANVSTVLWDHVTNTETPLPDMPGGVVRVYPASGATAMLPLTPANNYTPTVLFCGGSDMPDYAWGNYTYPYINTWEYPASKDCQRLTAEPVDQSAPVYVKDDDMLEGRTMGQFVILPTGKLLIVNGGLNGTAGYSQATLVTPSYDLMPYGESLASGPVLTPAIYDPNAPKGSRWSNKGLGVSTIPRLYHSSAILLPDASVLIAGSNPNVDVNLTTVFPTTYKAEVFYPPYFSAATRPAPVGIPKTLSYGGPSFDITIPATSYSGSANDAADSASVVIHRGGFTTHAMNMGQRLLQLNNTYTVKSDGSIILHVAQVPPNPNLFQPGPAFMFVNINGIPSNGSYLIVGNGKIGTQPVAAASVLPPNVRLASASGSASGTSTTPGGSSDPEKSSSSNLGVIIGCVVGGVALVGVVGAVIGVCLARRRRAAARHGTGAVPPASSYPMTSAEGMSLTGSGAPVMGTRAGMRSSDSSAFMPLQQDNRSQAWNASTTSLNAPYRDDHDAYEPSRPSGTGMSINYDPYATTPMQHETPPPSGLRY
ncbi:Aldehyde oxidase GLOX [Psilocybe cubensis]|uniref:Aldehyde oxidase GLOX n=2 Tax=Psilocybe cubensis TaxID=181762 RepID=A0ACB8GJK9_PSICU|nr:Aldehyde oxidase GLOX [Psilocybe cubensis]KAH9475866.1 Aldehyde oxidase GLOX [Psilocybe cubensis]